MVCILLILFIPVLPAMTEAHEFVQLTNLPTVYINTDSGHDPKDKKHQIPCQITIVSEHGDYLLQDSGTVRLRGNSTLKMPKKPYRLKFAHKQQPLNAPAMAKKWTLLANYGDKSLMRNAVAFYIAKQFDMEYVPYLTPVDVVMNGEYKGNYQLCDQVEARKGRVDIEEMSPSDNRGGFLLEIDAYAVKEDKEGWFYSNHNLPVTFKSPDSDDITKKQRKYIQRQFNLMEVNWRHCLDITSFLQHFLVGEMTANKDTYWSVFVYKHSVNDSLLHVGPVWDFDLSMDNCKYIYPSNWFDNWVYKKGGSHAGEMDRYVSEIINTSPVQRQMKEMWAHARQNGLREDSICAFIDQYQELIYESAELNFERWDILDHTVHFNPRAYYTYDAEVEAVRMFMRDRIRWMDDMLDYTPTSDDPSSHTAEHVLFRPNEPYLVYSIMGELILSDTQDIPQGIYIVRQGMHTFKVFIP